MNHLKYSLVLLFTFLKVTHADEYREKIQPIFDNRCIACHSCLNGPCQLNLQNYENFQRGANHKNVYDGLRTESVLPSRPGIDGKTKTDWQKLGFFDVAASRKLEENIFYQILGVKSQTLRDLPTKTVEESMTCVESIEKLRLAMSKFTDIQMPYALPPLSSNERDTLGSWLEKGAPGPKEKIIPKNLLGQLREWEVFLNKKSEKEKLVNRYLFEHLYLAHIYFPEEPTTYFRFVRSKTKCEAGMNIDELATRRANDRPGANEFFYCLKLLDSSVMAKTHMPFEFNPKFQQRLKTLFFSEKWEVTDHGPEYDSYSNQVAENPFIAFNDIPAKARYQFLLDNSHFIISTFIKGPVCNGSNAVNSIQEQFFVMFIKPESDNMVISKTFENKARDLLILPGVWGSDVKLSNTLTLTKTIVDHREGYRKLRAEETHKNNPIGYELDDLWDGDGTNPNATLTVFRHNDNAAVLKGFKGDLSKTMFFLDYALMERLVYNLVVNFDVFGNVSHQMLTRIYMDLIRMEAEEIFLTFLPVEQRKPMRDSWYKGLLTEAKMKYVFPLVNSNNQSAIKFTNPKNAKREFIEKVFYDYLTPAARGNADALNWRNIDVREKYKLTNNELILKEIAGLKIEKARRFPNFFPENSYLIVKNENGQDEVFTLLRNAEHENISWILGESLRMSPKEDTVTVLRGFYSYYPNQFFVVPASKLNDFKNKIIKIKYVEDYKKLSKEFGVSRLSENFWEVYDNLNAVYKKETPTEFGQLDLTRYVME